jgi:hypothetical protein
MKVYVWTYDEGLGLRDRRFVAWRCVFHAVYERLGTLKKESVELGLSFKDTFSHPDPTPVNCTSFTDDFAMRLIRIGFLDHLASVKIPEPERPDCHA